MQVFRFTPLYPILQQLCNLRSGDIISCSFILALVSGSFLQLQELSMLAIKMSLVSAY